MINTVVLKELQIGDKFIHVKDLAKRTPVYRVEGDPEFNSGHGSSTREC